MELAYGFIETYARYPILGDVGGFLSELIRRRWNLACSNLYEPPPGLSQHHNPVPHTNLLSEAPAGLTLASVDRLSLTNHFIENFRQFAAGLASSTDRESTGKLYGYGTDGYGTYIPLHLLWPEKKDFWGIYISEIGVLNLAAQLYQTLSIQNMQLVSDSESQQINRLIQIAYQVILRHQLFHFKVEQWALLFELATGRPYYLPYLQFVYLPTIYSPEDNNLEEALANLSILLSKKIQKIEKEGFLDATRIIERDFLRLQGPSYRNYGLNKGIPPDIVHLSREYRYREVVNYLCNQIIRQELEPQDPLVPYYLYPPNNNFLRAENLCPIYLVRNLPYKAGVIA